MAILDYQLANYAFESYSSTGNSNKDKLNVLSAILPEIVKNELSKKQQQCIYLKFKKNLTQKQIGQELGINQSTVSKHITSAKEIISQNLKYAYSALGKIEH